MAGHTSNNMTKVSAAALLVSALFITVAAYPKGYMKMRFRPRSVILNDLGPRLKPFSRPYTICDSINCNQGPIIIAGDGFGNGFGNDNNGFGNGFDNNGFGNGFDNGFNNNGFGNGINVGLGGAGGAGGFGNDFGNGYGAQTSDRSAVVAVNYVSPTQDVRLDDSSIQINGNAGFDTLRSLQNARLDDSKIIINTNGNGYQGGQAGGYASASANVNLGNGNAYLPRQQVDSSAPMTY